MGQQTFTLTEEHVTLLRRMYVGWCGDEFGAPEIDPKRPYGNSNVVRDMYEILAGATATWDDDHGMPSGLSPEEWDPEVVRLEELHKETRTALQVVLATGSFEPGEYVASEYRIDWERAPF